ncbi:MAG: helix-turn-helix transcriptional regulator [Planctomycetota bacterium]
MTATVLPAMSGQPDDYRATFGRNLKAARNRRGLSQMDLGRELDIHVTAIARLETGNRDPRLATIIKLARGLHVRPAELLDGIE